MFEPKFRAGLYLPELGLWMDAARPKPFSVISHAHGDHVARHESFLASPATIDLIRVRHGDRFAQRGVALPYGEWRELRDYRLRLLPAGHVLGSAMVQVESEQFGSLLYTGDFKLAAGLAAEPIEVAQADILVMESTFGRPQFVFPPMSDVRGQLIAFCRESLDMGMVPVLLAYSLGKAQEVLMALQGVEVPLMVHRTIEALNQVYRYRGFAIPETRPLDFLNMHGCVAVMPPAVLKQLPREGCRVAMVSGWGVESSARYRYRADAVIPLSDHADYQGLFDLVERVQPKRVYSLHGYDTDFAAALRRAGWNAWSLSGRDQLELF